MKAWVNIILFIYISQFCNETNSNLLSEREIKTGWKGRNKDKSITKKLEKKQKADLLSDFVFVMDDLTTSHLVYFFRVFFF